MKVVALMPMKANSERVKGKNFRSFGGKPLFRWMLDTLTSVSEIDIVVINTDAREILAEHGLIDGESIIIRDRKPEICGDLVSMNLVIEDDVENIDADIYLMTHTTNPFLSKKSIEEAIKKFKYALDKKAADSLFSVNKSQERFYYQNGLPINHDPTNLIRTQDLEPWFIENSNLYLFTRESFRKTRARIGLKPIMLETPLYESTDIDTPSDWDLAEAMLEYYIQKGILNEA
jgi:CMP-N-acetylneuraminic acid synthetase